MIYIYICMYILLPLIFSSFIKKLGTTTANQVNHQVGLPVCSHFTWSLVLLRLSLARRAATLAISSVGKSIAWCTYKSASFVGHSQFQIFTQEISWFLFGIYCLGRSHRVNTASKPWTEKQNSFADKMQCYLDGKPGDLVKFTEQNAETDHS